MSGHQSIVDPPPEGSAKCSLDLRALLTEHTVHQLLSHPHCVAQFDVCRHRPFESIRNCLLLLLGLEL